MNSEKQKGIAALAACAILWSTGGIFIKMVDWNPMAIAGSRSLVAGIFILAVTGRPEIKFTRARILAALAHSLTMILFVIANKMTSAANAILLQYTAPVYVALLGWLMLKEKPSWHHWAALTAVLGGMLLFFRDDLSPGNRIGNLVALGSGVSFALFSLFMRMQKNGSNRESVLLSNMITAVVAIPFYFKGPAPDVTGWMSIGALGIFQTGLALVLFSAGIKKIRAITAMLIAALEPLLNPVWVFIFTGERPGSWALLGGGVILTAVTLSSLLSAAGERSGSKPPAMPVPD